jgi:hypothetical protein
MNRNDLQALASGEMHAAADFMQFSSGSKRTQESEDILSALQMGAPLNGDEYEAPRDLAEYGGLDPWEVDYAKGQRYLQDLVGLVPEEDVHAAYRYIGYLLGRGMGDAAAERNAVDGANALARRRSSKG